MTPNDTKRPDPKLEIVAMKALADLAGRLKDKKDMLANCGSAEQIEALAAVTVDESLQFTRALMLALDHQLLAKYAADDVFNEMSGWLIPKFKALLDNYSSKGMQKFIDGVTRRCQARIAELERAL